MNHAEPSLNSDFWKNRKVLVTGGAGFLGRHIVEPIKKLGAKVIVPRRKEYNFVSWEPTLACMEHHKPDMVIHSAAYYGGLGITMKEAGTIYFQNLVMGANVMEAARQAHVEKFVTVGTACSYPGHLSKPLEETDLWSGPLHGSVLGYGSVKKMLAIQGTVYKTQYNFNSIHLVPSNLYGPYDCYDHYRSHVVAALIKKFCDAHLENEDVYCWGTGKAIREFLYIEDCAKGVLLAAQNYNSTDPLNVGTGIGTSIRVLATAISQILNFKGKIHWDATKPDGQPVKILDTTRMEAALQWKPQVSLKEGLEKSIEWYFQHEAKESFSKTNAGIAVPIPDAA